METSVLSQYSIIRTGFTLLPETETNKQTKYWKHFFKIPGNKGEWPQRDEKQSEPHHFLTC